MFFAGYPNRRGYAHILRYMAHNPKLLRSTIILALMLVAAAGAILLFVVPADTREGGPLCGVGTCGPIRHIVIIIKENHSFR